MENQLSFADCEYRQKRHQTRKEKFLARMEEVIEPSEWITDLIAGSLDVSAKE